MWLSVRRHKNIKIEHILSGIERVIIFKDGIGETGETDEIIYRD